MQLCLNVLSFGLSRQTIMCFVLIQSVAAIFHLLQQFVFFLSFLFRNCWCCCHLLGVHHVGLGSNSETVRTALLFNFLHYARSHSFVHGLTFRKTFPILGYHLGLGHTMRNTEVTQPKIRDSYQNQSSQKLIATVDQ